MKRFILVGLGIAALAVAGCGREEGGDGYSDEDLSRYRGALPSRSALTAPMPPTGAAVTSFGTNDALYPGFAVPVAVNINQLIGGTLDIIELIAEQEPTAYDSEELEFWWGPIPGTDNDIEDDHYTLYIKDRVNDGYDPLDPDDFRYEFAVIRGVGNDVATLTPVLYGVGRRDEESQDPDHGAGAIIFDFDNDAAFVTEHDPMPPAALTQGRMAAIFAKGPDESNPAAIGTYAIAAFRDFLPDDAEAGQTPIDVDYLFGNIEQGTEQFDFIDFGFDANVIEDSAAEESLTMKLAFYNEGVGRALVDVTGGDAVYPLRAEECWDASVQQTFLALSVDTGMGYSFVTGGGDETACPWDATEFESVPDLDDVADLLTVVGTLADAGLPADLQD